MVAAAAIGGAVVGGVASNRASRRSSSAVEAGAESSAAASVEATQLQVAEIQRQFNYQQSILLPQIQRQYAAQTGFSDLLGLQPQESTLAGGGGAPAQGTATAPPPGSYHQVAPGSNAFMAGIPDTPRYMPLGRGDGGLLSGAGSEGLFIRGLPRQREARRGGVQNYFSQGEPTEFQRGERGEFIDPNLDPTSLADEARMADHVQGSLMAGTDVEDDGYFNFVRDNRLADGAAGTGVYGETFEESPGYDFAREEMERQLERTNSAGGNFGGRAIMEAQRRAKGLADQEYYNWARGRTSDLQRRGQAEAMDAGRGENAYENYLSRRQGDTARMDAAVSEEDRLSAVDLQRRDQGYYNYLGNLSRMAGFGDPAGQAVASSEGAGGAVASAYGNRGNRLSQIYGNLGSMQAGIEMEHGANVNNAIQSGMQNYITWQMTQ